MGNNRKKHRASRRNAKNTFSPGIDDNKNQQKVSPFNDPDIEMPQWLKNAYAVAEKGQIEEAAHLLEEKAVQKATEGLSDHERVFVLYQIAKLLSQIGDAERAKDTYEEILKANPNPVVYNDLGTLYRDYGHLNKAIECYEMALEKVPNEPRIWSNLGLCMMSLGHIDKAIEILRKVAEKLPDNNLAHSNLFLNMHYLPDVHRSSIFEQSRRWAQRKLPLSLAKTDHNNTPSPDRRLKIGYISPDFCSHSVTFFFEPLLDSHDRDIVEVYGYGNVKRCDSTTERLKSKFDHYRNIRPLDDKAIAELIEKDNIDILVDLSGHSADSRVYVMAYKPAPIQVTWLGYPDTTGMSQIDYRLTDEIADPGGSEKFYTEELFYLPQGFLCYGPGELMPPVVQSPCMERKSITFGSFNNSTKINPVVIEMWSRILKSTPDSSLLLKFRSGRDDEIRQIYLDRFAAHGISPDRIATSGWLPDYQHLELYGQIDIALDTFPYNGTTTTCQALLMGVPVISLAGDHHMSRVGCSILTRLGLEFFVASTPDEYVAKAIALASNAEALDKIRSNMRTRMAVSPLCNKAKFAENMENAYRQMWRRWCQSQLTGVSSKQPEPQMQDLNQNMTQPSSIVQTNESSVQKIIPKTNLHKLSHIAELAVMADEMHRTGQRKLALKHAAEALDRTISGEMSGDVPQSILLKWNVRDERALFLQMCISMRCFSGYFDKLGYIKMFTLWRKFEPSNPEPYLRLGLLLASCAKRDGIDIFSEAIELLQYADNIMHNERSATVLKLAQNKISELTIPYDGGRIHVCPDLSNITTYVLLEQGDWFEYEDLALFRTLIRPDDMVLDLGSNVGVYAISAALRTGVQGRVVAVEPAKATFELLNRSASGFPNMTAIHGAVSDKAGTASLLLGKSSELNELGTEKDQGEQVQVFSVDGIADRMGIDCFDIIKMDVENYEFKALAGAKKIIHENSPIIFYEIKKKEINFELIEAFSRIGYDSYYYVHGTSTLVKFREGMQLDSYLLNMVAARPQSLDRFDGLVNIADRCYSQVVNS